MGKITMKSQGTNKISVKSNRYIEKAHTYRGYLFVSLFINLLFLIKSIA